MRKVYLDYAATTPVDPRVRKFLQKYYTDVFGNTRSIHSVGQIASREVEKAREFIAGMLNCSPEEVIFTSGGTESNNTAIKGLFFAHRGYGKKLHIITSTIEHHAVLEPIKFLEEEFKGEVEVSYASVSGDGIVDVDKLFSHVKDNTFLISVMHANNEIGTIQPIEKIGSRLKTLNEERAKENKQRVYFHTDAVQTFGHIEVDVEKLNVDLLSISGHKFYAPKGIGVLYVRKGVKIQPLLHGGGHEFGLRSSTVNVTGVMGFYKAAEIAKYEMDEENKKIKDLRDRLAEGIIKTIPDIVVNGDMVSRLVNNFNICIRGVEGESIFMLLDRKGIYVSSGSACSSGSLEPSHVLLAIGREPVLARGSLRFTLGRFTREEDIDYVLKVLPKVVEKIRRISPLY
jgi:cysteine desulfurase